MEKEKETEKKKKKQGEKEVLQFYIYKLPIDRPAAATGKEVGRQADFFTTIFQYYWFIWVYYDNYTGQNIACKRLNYSLLGDSIINLHYCLSLVIDNLL